MVKLWTSSGNLMYYQKEMKKLQPPGCSAECQNVDNLSMGSSLFGLDIIIVIAYFLSHSLVKIGAGWLDLSTKSTK